MDRQVRYAGNLPGNPLVGFQVKKLETHRWVSRSKAGNPPLFRFQKAGHPLTIGGFPAFDLETCRWVSWRVSSVTNLMVHTVISIVDFKKQTTLPSLEGFAQKRVWQAYFLSYYFQIWQKVEIL